jgi:thiol:disulfide interchange protein DsbD
MRSLSLWLLGLILAPMAVFGASGTAVATDDVTARLIAETDGVAPGGSVWVALEFQIRDGWHTYWRNPGDSGQATALAWKLPAGFTAGDILWTTPHRFELAPLVNYGYAKHAMHLVKVTAPATLKTGGFALLEAKASWLVCSDVCIPENADLQLRLSVMAHPVVDPVAGPLFAAARSELPENAPAQVDAHLVDGRLVLGLGPSWGAALTQIKSLTFFPYDDGVIEYAAPQTLTRGADSIELAIKVGYQPPKAGDVRGLLVAAEDGGAGGSSVPLEIAAHFLGGSATANPRYAPAAATSTRPDATPTSRPGAADVPTSLPVLVLLAVLGGLILNLMPCVFPVLSIKAIGLVESAKKHPTAARLKGLAFAAGVIGSMLFLAAVLLTLRSGGEEVGWGFQLQSPLFVTLMAYLLLAVGLNLSGVFEIGGGLAGVGDGLTRGDGYRAAFFTGVLTTLVATPCTAPFMAAAVGAALTQSALVAIVIFAALGFGLALPFTLLSFAPALRRALPKPGAWMDILKQAFAFPMYASAAWLLWVLAQQTSSLGLGAALAGAVLIALAAWAYQKSHAPGRGRIVALITSGVALILALWLPAQLTSSAGSTAAAAAPEPAGDVWQPYDAARVAELRAARTPLLVNFTASWCLTCLVNERNAFADSDVETLFRTKGVALMKGDWTNRDPAITRALAEFGRAGVPLYLVYNAKPGSSEPLVLPQLLTAGLIRDTFAGLPDRPASR